MTASMKGVEPPLFVPIALAVAFVCVLSYACASSTPRRGQAVAHATSAPPSIRYGITDGGYTGVPFWILGAYCDAGPTVVRSPVRSVDEASTVLASEAPCASTAAHLLIEGEDRPLATALGEFAANRTKVSDVECGNELELRPLELPIDRAAAFVGDCARSLRAGGYLGNILTAAIYTVDAEQLKRLKAYRDACPTCGCAIHWYGGDITEWKDEIDALACPYVAITEMGRASRNAAEDAEQEAYYREEVPGFWTLGATLIESYQRASGASTSDLDNFGQFRLDQSPKAVWLFWRSLLRGLGG